MLIVDLKSRAAAANEVKDTVEQWAQSSQFPALLARLIPACLKLLDGAPSFISTSPEQVCLCCPTCSMPGD